MVKYSTARRIFDSILGVSIYPGETLSLLFNILHIIFILRSQLLTTPVRKNVLLLHTRI